MPRALNLYTILEALLGRRLLWRLGRFLYLGARRELSNDPKTDGEWNLQNWLAAALKHSENPVIWDVGANLGVWSSALMHTLERNRVNAKLYAFEPAPAQFQALSLIPVPSMVTCRRLKLALSATTGQSKFTVTGERTGSSHLAFDGEVAKPETSVIDVEVSTVDAVAEAESVSRIHFMKIDTEGNDLNVIRGAKTLLEAKKIDFIQFEYGPKWILYGNTLYDAMYLAASHGYIFGKLTSDAVEVYEEWHPELDRFILGNFLMFRPEGCRAIPIRYMQFDHANVAVGL